MIARDTILRTLQGTLVNWQPARAAWLGGSDASGRTDPLSDIDLMVIVEDGRVEDCFARIEAALSALSPIEASLRLPSPTWHGHAQAFYALKGAHPCHMIDAVVIERGSTAGRFLERERHGDPFIIFDRDGLICPASIDRSIHRERIAHRVTEIKTKFRLFVPLVEKAIARGHVAEAVHFYHGMALRPVIDLMRIRHSPERFDFGPRYLDRDVPAEVRAAIERLSLPGNLDELSTALEECRRMFEAILPEIQEGCE